jgi:hypothetical protein
VAFFDLVGSTAEKLEKGHERGLEDSLKAVLLFRRVVEHRGGYVVKELGDGILARFDDPLTGVLAGLDILSSSLELSVKVKAALTLGLVDLLRAESGITDIFGSTIDRCSRIESCCLPTQLLVDRPLYDAVHSYLASFQNIQVGKGKVRFLKGIGDIELFEVSCSDLGLKRYIFTDFRIHEAGRIPLNDKVNFVKDAHAEVIEIGTGLRTFSRFFSGQRPAEFRTYIENLVVKGVNVTILALDPDWDGTSHYLCEGGNRAYHDDIRRSLNDLKKEQRRLLSIGVRGIFEIRVYQTYPFGHVLCVDPNDDLFGRMFASYYVPGLTRAECPVLEFSSLSNPELFQKHKAALRFIIQEKSHRI